MFIACWTKRQIEGDGSTTYHDSWEVFESYSAAEAKYEQLLELDDTYCAAICKPLEDTEGWHRA